MSIEVGLLVVLLGMLVIALAFPAFIMFGVFERPFSARNVLVLLTIECVLLASLYWLFMSRN